MRRIIAMTVFAVALTMLGLAYSQSPKTAAPKVGKVLVKSLPKGIEGVELVGGKVKVKSGYKFVKQSNGAVTVAKMAGGEGGGLGVGGTWDCRCSGTAKTGTCSSGITGGYLTCYKSSNDTCNGTCEMSVIISGLRTGIIAY